MNVPYIINRRSILIALLISLLLHFSITLYVLKEKTGISLPLPFLHKNEEPEPVPQSQQKKAEWAETKARNSSFGAPVIFRDEPDEEIVPFFENEKSEQSLQEDSEVLPLKRAESDEILENEQPSAEKNNNVEKNIDMDNTSSTTLVQQKQNLPTHHKHNSSGSKTTQQKSVPSSFKPTFAGKPLVMNKKPPLSLAQLTQGVLNYAKDEGQYAVSMIGKKGGVPSEEQIKYERYLQKLGWCLQNSFSINDDRFMMPDRPITSPHIFLSLNKNGSLHGLRIVKSSGDPRVDSFMLHVFNDASSSFPPVPHYLPQNPFSITYVIDISPINRSIGMYQR